MLTMLKLTAYFKLKVVIIPIAEIVPQLVKERRQKNNRVLDKSSAKAEE